MSTGEKLPETYGPTSKRFTPPAKKATEKNVRGLADRRGFRLRVQPGEPGRWRLQDRKTGKIVAFSKRLRELRAALILRPTVNHKLREKRWGKKLPAHHWSATP